MPLILSFENSNNEHFIPQYNIYKQHEIASGNFGKVFKGELIIMRIEFHFIVFLKNLGILKTGEARSLFVNEGKYVAIKILKDFNSSEDFFTEAETALKFDHENVLKCLGFSVGNFNCCFHVLI